MANRFDAMAGPPRGEIRSGAVFKNIGDNIDQALGILSIIAVLSEEI